MDYTDSGNKRFVLAGGGPSRISRFAPTRLPADRSKFREKIKQDKDRTELCIFLHA